MSRVSVGAGEWTVDATVGSLPDDFDFTLRHCAMHDDLGVKASDGTALVVTVTHSSDRWPRLVVSQRFSPGPESGFRQGVQLNPEAQTLFIGAGERVLAYCLREGRRLWEDTAEIGFWCWRLYGDIVVMSAELELAAWDDHGTKLWSRFVEPPWDYAVHDGQVQLDIMGNKTSFDLRRGPGE